MAVLSVIARSPGASRASGPAVSTHALVESIVRACAVIYLYVFGLESAVRYALSKVRLDALIYVRDGLLLIIVLLCVGLAVHRHKEFRSLATCMAAIYVGACIGVLSGLPVFQVLFGVKVLLPFVAGFSLVSSGVLSSLDRPRVWLALWAVVGLGIAINHFYRFPWSGLTVTVGEVDIQANREWTAEGRARLSGFSRTSYDAAMLILLLHLYLVSGMRSIRARWLMTIASGAAIALTTSKGAVGALIVTSAFIPVFDAIRRSGHLWRTPCILLLIAVGFAGILAPLATMHMAYPTFQSGTTESFLFNSMVDRGWETWPKAFALLQEWQWILGRGIGGIGAAQQYFEAGLMNPADNMFVWLIVTGGLAGGGFYLWLLFGSVRLDPALPADAYAYLVLICVFAYGLCANMVESAIFSSALGAISAHLCAKRPRARDGTR